MYDGSGTATTPALYSRKTVRRDYDASADWVTQKERGGLMTEFEGKVLAELGVLKSQMEQIMGIRAAGSAAPPGGAGACE